MAWITALILGSFGAYGLGWYAGFYEGDLPLTLFLAVVVSGVYWVLERIYFLPGRKKTAVALRKNAEKRPKALRQQGVLPGNKELALAEKALLQQPWWLDWTAGIFPVLLVVFMVRSFLLEPFRIPSGSMLPTLYIGDLILVNKFYYGVRLPVLNTQIIEGHAPQRGDVIVFRYPPNPKLDYIKRVVGVSGDKVVYENKVLSVNGVEYTKDALPDFFDDDASVYALQFSESADVDGKSRHSVLNIPQRPPFVLRPDNFPFRENCSYTNAGVTCTVPPEQFFVMGDNRDNSLDSRFWGFVPNANIVGRAEYIWMNFDHLERIGRAIE